MDHPQVKIRKTADSCIHMGGRPYGCLCEARDYARSVTAAVTATLVVVVREVGDVA